MFSLSRCPSCPQWFSSTGCVNATGDQQMEIIFAITFRLLFFSLIFCFSSFIDFKFSLFFHQVYDSSREYIIREFLVSVSRFFIYFFFFVFLLLIFHYSQVYNPSSSSCTKFVKIFVTNPLFFFFFLKKYNFAPIYIMGFMGFSFIKITDF